MSMSSERSERRRFPRTPFPGEVRIGSSLQVEPTEISEGGMYVVTGRSLMLGSEVRVSLSLGGKELTVRSRIENTHEGTGMGLMFIEQGVEMKRKIKEFVDEARKDIDRRFSERQKILLIDDDLLLRKICRDKLAAEGFAVIESDGSIDVTDTLDVHPVRLIILNLDTRKIPGFKMLNILKKSMKYKKIPLLSFSRSACGDTTEKARGIGADACMAMTALTSATMIKEAKRLLSK